MAGKLAVRAGKLIRSGVKLSTQCPQGTEFCSFCSGTSEDRDMSVVLPAHTNNFCSDCGSIAGTHTLSPSTSPPAGRCRWTLTLSSTICTGVDVHFDIYEYTTGGKLRLEVISQPLGGGGGIHNWREDTTETGSLDCSAFSSRSIPFATQTIGACSVSTSSSATVTSL